MIQGHRGMRGMLPENTLPSFAAAIEAGVDAIEIDLQLTLDGEIVIHHDFSLNSNLCVYLDGTPINQTVPISNLTLAEIKKIDCGSKKNPRFQKQQTIPKTQIPTLQELFEMINQLSDPNAKRVLLNLEIKADPSMLYADMALKIVQAVKLGGFSDRVYYSSFEPLVLAEVRSIDPKATLGFIFDQYTLPHHYDVNKTTSKHNIEIISPEYTLVNEDNIRAMHELSLLVIPWTVNDPQTCLDLYKKGADGIITDYPADMLALFNR